MHFTIDGRLPNLNEYTRANRHNRFAGGSMKKNTEQQILECIHKAVEEGTLARIDNYPVHINYKWYEPNNRRDADNVSFAKKFIQDALVTAGILEDDSRKFVKSFSDTVETDKDNPRVEVELISTEGE